MKRICGFLAAFLLSATVASTQEYPMYLSCSDAESLTAAADMLHVEPGAVYAVYVWKVYIVPGTQTAAGYQQVVLRRTTSASTGGSTLVPSALTPFSSLFTGIVRENATGGGADGVTLANASYFVGTTTTVGQASPLVLFDATGLTKRDAIYIPAGGTVGLELHNNTGGAGGANHYACVQFSEEVK